MKPSYGSEWDRGEHFWSDIFGLELTVMNDFDMLKEVNTLFLYIYTVYIRGSFWWCRSFGMSQLGTQRGYDTQSRNIHPTEACKSVTSISFYKEVKAQATPSENNFIVRGVWAWMWQLGCFFYTTNVGTILISYDSSFALNLGSR